MMKTIITDFKRYIILGGCLCALLCAGCATVNKTGAESETEPVFKVNPVFGSNMMVQRDVPFDVYGTAEPGRPVIVRLGGAGSAAITGDDGQWRVNLDPVPAGGPLQMVISDVRNLVTFTNIMAGDIYLCSGQSNMAWPLKKTANAADEIAAADFPAMRVLQVPQRPAIEPRRTLPVANWQVITPRTAGEISAVAYFFGREIHQNQDIPVGLIEAAWGGTPAEAWCSAEALNQKPALRHFLDELKQNLREYPRAFKRFKRRENKVQSNFMKDFDKWYKHTEMLDPGMTEKWYGVDFDDADWETVELPLFWHGTYHGQARTITWLRRELELPEEMAGKELMLSLGAIDDEDITYFNGKEIGRTERDVPRHWSVPRNYRIPAEMVNAGRNVIAVRVVDFGTAGGFAGNGRDLKLSAAKQEEEQNIDLAGEWRSMTGVYTNPDDHPRKAQMPRDPAKDPKQPTVLFNGMINPLAGLAVRGVIWYQGESNVGRADEYRTLFAALINDWRAKLNNPALPFMWVQLANFRHPVEQPGESDWAELREAQASALRLTNTAMAVAIDIGDAEDIHPRNKQDVGYRLSLAARNLIYGEKLAFSGPRYREHEIVDGSVIIKFDHVADGLVAQDGTLKGFSIAGSDKRFVKADARIEAEQVVVSHPDVSEPVAVRYAWADNPDECNLYNSAGLPAVPFRTGL